MARATLASLVAVAIPQIAQAESYALIIAGLGGEKQYEQRFREQASGVAKAAEQLTGDKARVTVLSGEKATREAVRGALKTLASTAKRDDQVMIVLIGHGTFDGEEYRFNLPGPDLTTSEFTALFEQLQARDQLILNSTSASGATAERWARDNRVVITSTKSGGERTATRFAQFWVEAVTGKNADTNRDDVVTAAEAYEYANRKVAESYKADVSLATEHARLEGKIAGRFQVARFGNAILATSDAQLSELYTQRVTIERDLEAVKEQKASLQADAYYDRLEAVLVRLATLQKNIDARQQALGGRQ
jgi:hypothetical protein